MISNFERNEKQIEKVANDINFRMFARIHFYMDKFGIPKKYCSKVVVDIEKEVDYIAINVIAWSFVSRFNSVRECFIEEFGDDADIFLLENDKTFGLFIYENCENNDATKETMVCYWFPFGIMNDTVKLKEHEGIEYEQKDAK